MRAVPLPAAPAAGRRFRALVILSSHMSRRFSLVSLLVHAREGSVHRVAGIPTLRAPVAA
jgi:hypothetical protein